MLVVPPAVLTVQPGTVVRGVKNTSNPAALVVTRGAKLDANGTAADPIVFTSNQAPGARDRGDWGGVTLNGSAPVNFTGGEGSSEGLPPGLALYGGTDVADNSGRVRFTRVEFSGIEFSPDNELNVFTMNGLGTGTVIDHVQAHRGNDDCFEWFGGTVRAKYLVATACRDDFFDWQIGFRGSLQFGVAHQAVAGVDGSGRNAFESDNNEFGFDNLQRSNPRICNVTAIGAKNQGLAISGAGANLRRGTAGTISNTIFSGWVSSCLDIDNDETIARGCTGPATLRTGADTLLVSNSVCNNNGPTGTTLAIGSTTAPACTPAQLVGLWAPSTANPNIPWASAVTFPTNPINTADYVPTAPLAGPDCEALDPGAFDSAPFIGALQNGGINWLNDSAACAASQVGDCWLNADRAELNGMARAGRLQWPARSRTIKDDDEKGTAHRFDPDDRGRVDRGRRDPRPVADPPPWPACSGNLNGGARSLARAQSTSSCRRSNARTDMHCDGFALRKPSIET